MKRILFVIPLLLTGCTTNSRSDITVEEFDSIINANHPEIVCNEYDSIRLIMHMNNNISDKELYKHTCKTCKKLIKSL